MMKPRILLSVLLAWAAALLPPSSAFGLSEQFQGKIYAVGTLKPVDSATTLKVGDRAPDFSLPSLSGEPVTLSRYQGAKNVVISFLPAAWTPVCSEQWPGYNIMKSLFDENDAVLLGITADNLPTLFAWTEQMGGVWFPVLSDFWPHGRVSSAYGVLRSEGTSERALFIVDKQGTIRYIDVHNINERPDLETLARELGNLR